MTKTLSKQCYLLEINVEKTLEQNFEHVSEHVSEQVSEHVFLLNFGIFSGFAAIFLTANALCSPARKENPASITCGKKSSGSSEVGG